MYSKLQFCFKWIRYVFLASNSRGHGVHSPFVYELINEVLNDKRNYYAYDQIEAVKSGLLLDQKVLMVEDFGAGSLRSAQSEKKVSDIAAGSLSSKKFGRLLFRLANFYQRPADCRIGKFFGHICQLSCFGRCGFARDYFGRFNGNCLHCQRNI